MTNKIEEIFGPKCDTYEEDCPTCVVYKALEEERQKREEVVEAEREKIRGWFGIPIKQIDLGKPDCDVCGGILHRIRGRHPNEEKRFVCPTCAIESLEYLRDQLSYQEQQALTQPNNPKQYDSNSTNSNTIS